MNTDGDIVEGRLVIFTVGTRHGLGPRRLPGHAVVGLAFSTFPGATVEELDEPEGCAIAEHEFTTTFGG